MERRLLSLNSARLCGLGFGFCFFDFNPLTLAGIIQGAFKNRWNRVAAEVTSRILARKRISDWLPRRLRRFRRFLNQPRGDQRL